MQVKVTDLTKQYKNGKGVNAVSFTLKPGINGLLGANGAGKTTLMRMMAGILQPDRGHVYVDDFSVFTETYRSMLGYLPQHFGFYPEFTARKFMMYLASLKGLEKRKAQKKTEELLELVGLSEQIDQRIHTFSRGMAQRLGIAQVLINDPKILILDEPTAGLDPMERANFRTWIAQLGKERIVLFSTHIVSDLEQIANRVLILKEGRLLYDGPWNANRQNLEQFYIEEVDQG